MDYNDLYSREYVNSVGKHESIESIMILMGRGDFDNEKLKRSGAAAAIARMMENNVTCPDEHDPQSVAFWAKKGMVKEFHGEDVPMDWEDYNARTGLNYDYSNTYPQNMFRKWTSFVPASAFRPENRDRKYPTIVVLHGAGNTIYTIDGWGYVDTAAEMEWIVLVPSLECDEVVLGMLEEAKKLYPIDETRIYLSGFSYGSMNTNVLAIQHPEVFAAAAPCGGFLSDGVFRPLGRPNRPGWTPPPHTEPWFSTDGDASRAQKLGMPVMSVIGNRDSEQWPIRSIPRREERLGFLNFWLKNNGVPELSDESLDDTDHWTIAEQYLGLPLETGCSRMLTADGVDYAIGDFKDADGITRVRLICEDNIPHWPTPELSRQVMGFFSHFSRDPETKKSVYRA